MSSVTLPYAKPPTSSNALRRIRTLVPTNIQPFPRNTKGYLSTYLDMGLANVRTGTQKRRHREISTRWVYLRTWLQLGSAHTLASSRSQAMGGAPSAQIRAATWAQNLGADLRQKEHDHHTPRSFV